MGTLQDQKELRGIGLPDQRITFENLNPVDGSATGSDYDEAGPRPGTAISDDPKARLVVEVQHAQGEDLEVRVVKSGEPGPDAPLEVIYRETDDDGTAYDGWRAWNRPAFLHHVHGIHYEPVLGLGPSSWDAAVIPSSQVLCVVYCRSGGMFARVLDGSGWSSERTIQPPGAGIGDCAVVCLPSERLVAVTTSGVEASYFSDDGGQTWEEQARGLFPGLGGVRRARAVMSGDLIVLIREDTVTFNTRQYVSRDLGATFELVASGLALGQFPELLSFPDGSIGVVSRSTGFFTAPTFRRVGSPYTSLGDSTAVFLDLGTIQMVDACADPDGVLWVITKTFTGSNWEVWTSSDLGESWTQLESDVLDAPTGGPRPPVGKLISVDGSFAWITEWEDVDGGVDLESLQVLWLGGWQNVGVDPRAGWGVGTGTLAEDDGATFLPVAVPGGASSPFTVSGAGTEAIVSPGALEVTTVAQVRVYSDSLTGLSTPGYFKGIFYLQHVSGGSVNLNLCHQFNVNLGDGVDDYHFSVRVGEQMGPFALETVVRVVDENSGATLIQFVPLTDNRDQYLEFLVDMNGIDGELELQWRRTGPAGPASQWETLYSGPLTNDTVTPIGIGRIRWGSHLVSTEVTRWFLVAYKAADAAEFQAFFAYNALPTGSIFRKRGRPIGGIGFPLGFIEGLLPAFRDLETKTVFLALRGGPGVIGEVYSVPASYDFAVDNLFAELSPSPSSTFRTRTRRPVTLAWTFDQKSRIGDSWILGVLLLRQNFRRAWIDVDVSASGTGTWVQIGEVNPAFQFEGLAYLREGDQVRPDGGTTIAAGRYLHRNELAGGLFVVGGLATRILGNTSGRWTSSPTVAPILTLEDGSVVGASGLCDIVFPRALRVIHLDGVLADFVTGVRLRFDDSLFVDGEDFLEAGIARIVALTPFGQQPSRGWTQEMAPNTSETVSRSGTIRKRFEGPPARRWTWSWPDGVRFQWLRQDERPDFLGVAGKPGAIVKEDVATLIWGLLEELRGGEVPLVALNRFPKSTLLAITITDRTLFLFGTWDGSGRFDQVLGDEGVDEYGRVSPVAVRELV